MSPDLGGNTPKFYAVVDGKFPDDLDSESIFRKVTGHKLYSGSRDDLYLRCRMNFASDVVQTQDPHFMDLGIPAINTLDESGVLGTPTTRILRPMYGFYWSATDHRFGEATAVGMSV